MLFSIGHISRLLGFTRQAVRFYEEKGIITPQKNAKGWRYYDEEAVARLISARKYMAMGYQISEVVKQFSTSTPESVAKTLDEKYEETNEKIRHLQKVSSTIDDYRKRIRYIKDEIDHYVIRHSPSTAIFYSQPFNQLKEELIPDSTLWVNALPISRITAFYDGQQMKEEKTMTRKHKGFSIDQDLAEAYGLLSLDSTQLIPSRLCVHTIVTVKSEEIASLKITEKALPFFENAALEIDGDPWGQIIFSASNKGDSPSTKPYQQYIDLWIPAKEIK